MSTRAANTRPERAMLRGLYEFSHECKIHRAFARRILRFKSANLSEISKPSVE